MNAFLDTLYRQACRRPRLRGLLAWLHSVLGRNRQRVRGHCNQIQTAGAFLRDVRIEVTGDGNEIVIAPLARLQALCIRVTGNRHRVSVGEEVCMKAGSLILEDHSGCLEIGAETTIEQAEIAVTEGGRVALGRDCMLAFGIDIRNGDSHAVLDAGTGQRINPAEDVRIGDHVWIGAHVQVLKGADVGAGSVVGARSLVTGRIPEQSVACGIPAKPARSGVRWTRAR